MPKERPPSLISHLILLLTSHNPPRLTTKEPNPKLLTQSPQRLPQSKPLRIKVRNQDRVLRSAHLVEDGADELVRLHGRGGDGFLGWFSLFEVIEGELKKEQREKGAEWTYQAGV